MAATSLWLNLVLLVSGGVVRLTDSGLGCPTWPRCTEASLVTTPAMGVHGYIEFGNRLLGVALMLIAVALVTVTFRARPAFPAAWRCLAGAQALVVPAQALIGGILVLTDLNPYVRSLHFLVSFPILLAATALLRRTRDGTSPRAATTRGELRLLTAGLLATVSAVLAVGALVTGTGPHAGDPKAARLPFDPAALTQIHTDLVYLLLGLTLATTITARALRAPQPVQRGSIVLVALIAAQGLLGYVQYHTRVPPLLVALHMLGAGLIFVTAAWTHLSTTGPVSPDSLLPSQLEPR
ncbi:MULTISPECIES: COX15/CtaA family protein [Streptomyces]|uniref:COX15/CtaA family protein n=1 Tax=Streptomyces TaxID=1883 RepID=UPI00287FD229|nr:COX15/CtaA family protein [Streptomyces sp. CGMCC 4.1456]WNF67224.1 COX15/CtaA family protein [Streptomyces sp. CGMCC 4.1456]